MLRLRQVVWVASDLEATEATIAGHFGLKPSFRDPALAEFGLENVVMPCGEQFIEVVSPVEAATAAGRLLKKRFGDGGYMVILQTQSLDWVRVRVDQHHVRIVYEAKGDGITGLHLHPADVGATLLSIDACDKSEEWPWAGSDWRDAVDTSVVDAIVAVELQAAEPEAVARTWSSLLGCPIRHGTLRLDDAEVRFVPARDGRGDGLRAVDLRATDRSRAGEQRMIHGVEVNLR